MKDKKTINQIFKYIFIAFFVCFLTLYMANVMGYYEYSNHKKMVFTEEAILKFEEDVKNGKNLDLANYLKNDTINYQNGISKVGLNISNGLGKIIKNSVESFFNTLNKLVQEN